jgi:multidrug resistance efflux pump
LTVVLVCGPGSSRGAQQRGDVPAVETRGEGVYNAVEGTTTIISIKPLGSRVKKGDLVCELESFAVRTRLAQQEIATKAAEAPYEYAKRAREIAELSITEFVDGVYRPQLQSVERAIALAESELKKAEGNLATTRNLVEKGIVHPNRIEPAALAVQQARLGVEKAQGKKTTLEKFTKERKVKELQSKVERARAEELARQAEYGREQSALDQLKKQLDRCKLLAPTSGRLIYTEAIEEGAEVTKGVLVFRVVPEAEPKAAAK